MSKIASSLLLFVGLIVLVFGANVSFSHSADWSRYFDWAHSDKSKWLLIAGLLAAILGVVGLLRPSKSA